MHNNLVQRRAGGVWDGHVWTYPELELTPDLSRGEQRLAAEAALEMILHHGVPDAVFERAMTTLAVLAKG